jgi:ABC-type glycerol-3-phosphate transport system substrate-binding protein
MVKSNLKRRTAFLAALSACIVGLAACGSSSTTKTDPTTKPVAPTTPTTKPISSGGVSY